MYINYRCADLRKWCKGATNYARTTCPSCEKKLSVVHFDVDCIMSHSVGAQCTTIFVKYARAKSGWNTVLNTIEWWDMSQLQVLCYTSADTGEGGARLKYPKCSIRAPVAQSVHSSSLCTWIAFSSQNHVHSTMKVLCTMQEDSAHRLKWMTRPESKREMSQNYIVLTPDIGTVTVCNRDVLLRKISCRTLNRFKTTCATCAL